MTADDVGLAPGPCSQRRPRQTAARPEPENCRYIEHGQTCCQIRMQIKNARRWPSTGAKPYAIAILAIVIASALRFALHPVLGADLPFLSFTIAGFLVAFLAGLWPALLVVAGGFSIG